MPKYHYKSNQQGITPDKEGDNHLSKKKYPYSSIISPSETSRGVTQKSKQASFSFATTALTQITQKVKHKMNKPLEPGLKMPKNYELKAIKLTSLALTTFLVTLFAASILTPVQTSKAETITPSQVEALVQGSAYYLTVSSTGTKIQLNSTPDGAITAGSDTVTVKTNSPTGYKLYLSTATAGENDNKLFLDGDVNNNSSTNSISPTTGTFTNPIALSNNTWGFALAKSDAESVLESQSLTPITDFSESYSTESTDSNSTWAAVPVRGEDQLIKVTKEADESETPTANNSLTVYYGVKATTEIQSGSYKNKILYTAISESIAQDTITVNPTEFVNGLTTDRTLTITTSLVTNISNFDTSTITARIGSNSCPITAVTNNESTGAVVITCTAPELSEGSYTVTVEIPDYGKTYTLEDGLSYRGQTAEEAAQQAQAAAITAINNDGTTGTLDLSSIITMQQMSAEVCNAMKLSTATVNPNKAYTLKDSRDQKTYNIAKLDDGLCWMVSNLRLGSTSEIHLTADDTDITSANYDSGKSYWATPVVQTSGDSAWDNTSKHIYQQSDTSYGNLYNWYTATAGTGTASMSSGDASASICPKGWQLPSGDIGIGSFWGLTSSAGISNSSAGSTKIRSAPYSFTYTNSYYSGLNEQGLYGSFGNYWSRTATSSVLRAYYLALNSNQANPYDNFDKQSGYAIRCIFTFSSFQNFTLEMCKNLETGKTITLYDNRDGNVYTVAKLGDNNCWQTQNMRLGATPGALTTAKAFTLTSADSDVNSNFEITTNNIQTSGTTSWGKNEKHVYLTGNSTYGNYYSWYTATSGSSTSGGEAGTSICPKSGSDTNWKLPPNTSNGSYATMFQSSGIVSSDVVTGSNQTSVTNAMQATPYSFPLSGYYSDGVNAQESYGRFWSRSAVNSNLANFFDFSGSGYFYLQYNDDKTAGFSVRCVLVTSE